MKLVWSPTARRRAQQAVDFIEEDSPRGAVDWLDGLVERVELLREKRESVSINQLVATALAEKLFALDTLEYLEARAARGSRQAFLEVLSRVPDAAPTPGDAIAEEEDG